MEIQRVARYHVSQLLCPSDSNTLIDIPSHLQALVTQLDALPPDDLRLLNLHIVEKFTEKQASRRASIMASFVLGDLVSFEDKQGQQLSATVIRTNKKTVSLMTLDEVRWNVAPELLTLQSSHRDQSDHSEVISAQQTSNKPPAQHTSQAASSAASQASLTSAKPIGATPSSPTRIGARSEWTGGMIQAPGMVTGEPTGPYTPSLWVWLARHLEKSGPRSLECFPGLF